MKLFVVVSFQVESEMEDLKCALYRSKELSANFIQEKKKNQPARNIPKRDLSTATVGNQFRFVDGE